MLKSAINKNTPDDYVQRLNDTLINKIWRKGEGSEPVIPDQRKNRGAVKLAKNTLE